MCRLIQTGFNTSAD
ncbi:hypothetical protein CUMW_276020 [Citrus unshiu]|uniref:Uncharacterized protein n=1 Tax=Citrus unshiu TaxID=55188 RepID=A0A2H5N0C2_CITUN|nr:hypothetical protein CUMW_276020 [Citrus unshiu]